MHAYGRIEKLATGKPRSMEVATEKLKIAKKYTNSGDIERTDTTANWKTRIAQKRNEKIQV